MNRIVIAAALGSLSALAMAQSAPPVEEVRVSGGPARIELPAQLRNSWPDQFEQIQGTYTLSNGKTMALSTWGNRMYAKIDGFQRSQLVAASPYEFVGLDRQMRIRISNAEGSGPIRAEVYLWRPALADASSKGTLTRLVASR
ncbi:MAG: hypothetical protein V4484_16325 [Pseudomonadota bacterium]